MPSKPRGELKLSELEYLTPCFEWSAACNLDWAAVAAIGAWFAAFATFAAVRVALKAADKQSSAAAAAVIAERAKAEHIQEREWAAVEAAHRRTAAQLARGFAKELAYARRQLAPRLINWEPFTDGVVSPDAIESYAAEKPCSDLVFLRSCADRLQGFADEDAFALLDVLTAWQFFNTNPGLSLASVQKMAVGSKWRKLTVPRVEFGLELLDLIDSTFDRMKPYYAGEPEADSVRWMTLSKRVHAALKDLRKNVTREADAREGGGRGDVPGGDLADK